MSYLNKLFKKYRFVVITRSPEGIRDDEVISNLFIFEGMRLLPPIPSRMLSGSGRCRNDVKLVFQQAVKSGKMKEGALL